MERSGRWIVWGVGAVTVLAVVAAFVASLQDTAEFGLDSPEGVVQAYLRSVADEDQDAALELLDDELRQRCDEPELRGFLYETDLSFRAELADVEREGDEATVEVRVSEFSGEPPFDGSGYDHDERFVLRRTDGDWRITAFTWPYAPCSGMP